MVSAAGHGVVSHAEVGLLREMAEYTGLVEGVTDALIGTCKGVPTHAPGRVFTDLAVAVADGADAISGIGVLTDREELFGPVASMPTTWRVLDRVGPEQLPTVRAAWAKARAAAWAAGAGPDLGEELRLDFDATITIAHSEKQNAAGDAVYDRPQRRWRSRAEASRWKCCHDRPRKVQAGYLGDTAPVS